MGRLCPPLPLPTIAYPQPPPGRQGGLSLARAARLPDEGGTGASSPARGHEASRSCAVILVASCSRRCLDEYPPILSKCSLDRSDLVRRLSNSPPPPIPMVPAVRELCCFESVAPASREGPASPWAEPCGVVAEGFETLAASLAVWQLCLELALPEVLSALLLLEGVPGASTGVLCVVCVVRRSG
eukprot:CAMPEP_0174930216 /NCGR_PEP_ID=MMETSP1355-20121228/30780_1 /TAXON_ID=464990 /ORGANISM="Hemiselmis tepida, Strain CCMP443" /LENGTH=184 /DNA_ID=CAMNT_0016176493 /DNA_START=168 /DNA_END=719 /DNA_ORIENTATION=-